MLSPKQLAADHQPSNRSVARPHRAYCERLSCFVNAEATPLRRRSCVRGDREEAIPASLDRSGVAAKRSCCGHEISAICRCGPLRE